MYMPLCSCYLLEHMEDRFLWSELQYCFSWILAQQQMERYRVHMYVQPVASINPQTLPDSSVALPLDVCTIDIFSLWETGEFQEQRLSLSNNLQVRFMQWWKLRIFNSPIGKGWNLILLYSYHFRVCFYHIITSDIIKCCQKEKKKKYIYIIEHHIHSKKFIYLFFKKSISLFT